MNRIAGRAGIAIVLVLLLLGGLGFFVVEYVTQAEDWAMFQGSPHVYNGGNLGTGTVVDRDGTILLDMNDGWNYSSEEAYRKATVHWLGDRNGNVSAPSLAAYSGDMVDYDLLTGVYTYADQKGVAELTLSSQVQKVALYALGNRTGTVAVYNYRTGQILCSVTTPTFDPDNAPDAETVQTMDGLYLNRFTQGSYTPGSIFKIVTLAAALESIDDIQQQSFTCTGRCEIGEGENNAVTCEVVHGTQDLKGIFCNSCNCAFAQISQQLGKETLQEYVEKFKITEPVKFDGISTQKGNFDLSDASELSCGWAAVGQYTDLVNPCAYLTFIGSVAAGGKGVNPYFVKQVKSGNSITYRGNASANKRIMSQETAETIQSFMRNNVEVYYGADNFPGLTVCAKTGTGQVGGDKKPNAMFTGFVADEQYPLAFIVCVEDAGYGGSVCMPIAAQVLAACKEVM